MLSSKTVTNMVKVLLNQNKELTTSQPSFTQTRKNAQKACRNLRGGSRSLIKQDSTNYFLFEVNKWHCRKLLETKENGEKVYCVQEKKCTQCPKEVSIICNMALYYHQVPRNVGDSITSVISSMMLTQRDIKFENMRKE